MQLVQKVEISLDVIVGSFGRWRRSSGGVGCKDVCVGKVNWIPVWKELFVQVGGNEGREQFVDLAASRACVSARS